MALEGRAWLCFHLAKSQCSWSVKCERAEGALDEGDDAGGQAHSSVLPRINRPCMSHEVADGNFMIILAW